MNVIAIEELANVVATKHRLSQQDADAFVNAFFKNIRNALASEKLVKIRGLGTFSVTVMKSTEYPGRRCKVMTFSPEPKLSKQINKPFAQFEVVTLADGVTFDDVAEETGDDSLIKAVAKEEISVDDLPMVESWVMVEAPETDDLVEETLPGLPGDGQTNDSEVAADSGFSQSDEDADSLETTEPKHKSPESIENEEKTDAVGTIEQESAAPRRGAWWKWAVVATMAACVIIGLFLMKSSKNTPSDTETTSEIAQTTPIENQPSTAEDIAPEAPEDKYAAENERVKYGAYRIVGLDTIITVTPGMDLQRIATIFLGSEMQMYLSAMNDGNDNPQPGEQYKIPKIELK